MSSSLPHLPSYLSSVHAAPLRLFNSTFLLPVLLLLLTASVGVISSDLLFSFTPPLLFCSHFSPLCQLLLLLLLLLLISDSLQRWDELCLQLLHWPPPSVVWSRQQTPKAVMTTEQMMIIAARLKTPHSSSSSQFHSPPLFLLASASPSVLTPNMFMALKYQDHTLLGPVSLPPAK